MDGTAKPKKPRTPTPLSERMPTKADIQRVLDQARALGLPIEGLEVAPGKVVRVKFAGAAESDADAELERWQKGRRGAG